MIGCYHLRPVRSFAALVLVALALARPAAADRPTTIAVIPLQADRRLALYGAPVASELAGALERAGFEVGWRCVACANPSSISVVMTPTRGSPNHDSTDLSA